MSMLESLSARVARSLAPLGVEAVAQRAGGGRLAFEGGGEDGVESICCRSKWMPGPPRDPDEPYPWPGGDSQAVAAG